MYIVLSVSLCVLRELLASLSFLQVLHLGEVQLQVSRICPLRFFGFRASFHTFQVEVAKFCCEWRFASLRCSLCRRSRSSASRELGTSLRRDDIVLSAELQAGAVKFDVEAKNKIALREKES